MDEENMKSWVSQPDVCRCCLSTSGTWDLTASYITDAGMKEVFSDVLKECYGVSMSYLSDWGPSHLICELCVSHLRDACSFKKQVLHAEEFFMEYWKSNKESVVIKNELDAVSPGDFNDLGNASDDDENRNKLENHTNDINMTDTQAQIPVREYSERKRQKRHPKPKQKGKKIKLCSDDDSDTPIAELSKKIAPLEPEIKTDNTNTENQKENELILDKTKLKTLRNKDTITIEGPHHMVPPIIAKQISERQRVILTCKVLLKDTTACPFRHHKSWFQCFFCSQDFMEISSLRNHTLQYHEDIDSELNKMKRYPRSLQIDISVLKCRLCNTNLLDVESMRSHLDSVHSKVIYNECIADYKVNSSPYSCHICNQEFHVFRTLTTHLNEHYANCICDVCGRSFINSKRLKVHKRTHENGDFPCTECGKVLKTKTSKANHMESAHSKRILKCQICLKPMKHYNDRIKHMSEVHNITHKFKCPICSREYNIKHYLATHIRQTHGNKNKKCPTCGMAFITNHGLKKHMSKHTGEKPFSCHLCSKAYARSYTLREHMRAHDNDRRFLCPE